MKHYSSCCMNTMGRGSELHAVRWGHGANVGPDGGAPLRVAVACEARHQFQAPPAGLVTALLRRGAEVLDAVDGLGGSDVVVAGVAARPSSKRSSWHRRGAYLR